MLEIFICHFITPYIIFSLYFFSLILLFLLNSHCLCLFSLSLYPSYSPLLSHNLSVSLFLFFFLSRNTSINRLGLIDPIDNKTVQLSLSLSQRLAGLWNNKDSLGLRLKEGESIYNTYFIWYVCTTHVKELHYNLLIM